MIETQVLKHLPGARKSERGRSKGNVLGGAMEKDRYVRVIEREEIRRDYPIEYFLSTGSEVPLESQRG